MKKNLFLGLIFISLFGAISTQAQDNQEVSTPAISIGLIVKDMDESLRFYTEILGMQKVRNFDINEDFGKRSGLSGGVPFKVQGLKLEDSPQASEWKLVSFEKTPKSKKSKMIQAQGGLRYVTILVNTLSPFLERIKKNNITLLGDTPISLGDERHFILIQDRSYFS